MNLNRNLSDPPGTVVPSFCEAEFASQDATCLRALCLKSARQTDPTGSKLAEEILRNETHIHKSVPLIGGYLAHSSGENDQAVWLTSRWLDGPAAGEATAAIVERPDTESSCKFRELLRDLAATTLELVNSGVLHGDLQPRHFVLDVSGKRWRLIDFGNARAPGASINIPEAGLIHFTSPEVARRARENPAGPPALDELSEVYSLGAVFSFLYTGRSSIDNSDESKTYGDFLDDIAIGNIVRSAPRATLESRVITELIHSMMQTSRANRPRLAQVVSTLQ